MTQKGHQTKYCRRKHVGKKYAFLHGKFEMQKEYISAQHTTCSLCNTTCCLQLSQLNRPEGRWNKKVTVKERQPWKLCLILKSPSEALMSIFSMHLVPLKAQLMQTLWFSSEREKTHEALRVFSKDSQRELWNKNWEVPDINLLVRHLYSDCICRVLLRQTVETPKLKLFFC